MPPADHASGPSASSPVARWIGICSKRRDFSQLAKKSRDVFMPALTHIIIDTSMTMIAVVM